MDLTWRKSSRSNSAGGNCVEIAVAAGQVFVRDSTDPTGPTLSLDTPAFRTFLALVRAGGLEIL